MAPSDDNTTATEPVEPTKRVPAGDDATSMTGSHIDAPLLLTDPPPSTPENRLSSPTVSPIPGANVIHPAQLTNILTTRENVDHAGQKEKEVWEAEPGGGGVVEGGELDPFRCDDRMVDKEDTGITAEACGEMWNNVDTAGWYDELRTAFMVFTHGKFWDPIWTRVVDGFLVFERRSGFIETGKQLSMKEHPNCIHAFIKEHRNWKKPRDVGDLTVLNKKWWGWWEMLQPENRGHSGMKFD